MNCTISIKNIYRIPEILEGSIPENSMTIKNAPFDEKLSLLGLLFGQPGTGIHFLFSEKSCTGSFFF